MNSGDFRKGKEFRKQGNGPLWNLQGNLETERIPGISHEFRGFQERKGIPETRKWDPMEPTRKPGNGKDSRIPEIPERNAPADILSKIAEVSHLFWPLSALSTQRVQWSLWLFLLVKLLK